MAFDALLMFFTNTTITQDISSSALTIYGTPVEGLGVRVSIPQSQEAGGTVQGRLWVSPDDSTYRLAGVSEIKGSLSSGGDVHFSAQAPLSDAKYAKLELIVTGTTAANINFGQVKAGVSPEKRGIDRTTNFE